MDFIADDISVALSGRQIIEDISLRVRGAQTVGLLGPNGSGKSTFLKCVYKVLQPDAGSASLNSFDLLRSSNKEVAQKLSVVSQYQELSFDFSVRQMVLIGRTPFKKLLEPDNAGDIKIAEDALIAVGLQGFEDRSYSTLSGGEKQRVILARAIAQTPSFLVLDEPTNHLDIKYQIIIMATVRKLGIGVLAALHDLTLAATFCDYIYLLKDGKAVADGEPEDVLTRELIRDIYEVECVVAKNPVNGRLSFIYDI